MYEEYYLKLEDFDLVYFVDYRDNILVFSC